MWFQGLLICVGDKSSGQYCSGKALGPDVHVDVTMTHTTYLNITADQEKHDNEYKFVDLPPSSSDINLIEHQLDVLD